MPEIVGHGIDLVECDRIRELAERHGQRFLDRVFTEAEQKYCQAKTKTTWIHFAGRFAVKEAVLKALGTGWRGQIAWTDVEVVRDSFGRPTVRLGGHTATLAGEKGIDDIQISISHTETLAMASAIALRPHAR